MTTVLQILALWVVLSGLVTAGVCLVVRGGNLAAERRTGSPAVATRGRSDAPLRDTEQSLTA